MTICWIINNDILSESSDDSVLKLKTMDLLVVVVLSDYDQITSMYVFTRTIFSTQITVMTTYRQNFVHDYYQ